MGRKLGAGVLGSSFLAPAGTGEEGGFWIAVALGVLRDFQPERSDGRTRRRKTPRREVGEDGGQRSWWALGQVL